MNRISNIAFLFFFFVLALLPALKIDRSSIVSKEENRLLAPFPFVFSNSVPNSCFGRQFEDWYSDRFWGRSEMVRLHTALMSRFDGRVENEKAFGKRNGWMFLTGPAKDSFGWSVFSDAVKKVIVDGLNRQGAWCNAHGIRFCFLLVPEKSTIYGEFAEWRFRRKGVSPAESLLGVVREGAAYPVVWPKQAFLRRKKDGLLYHPADSHWNMFGSRIAFFEVLSALGLGSYVPDDGDDRRTIGPKDGDSGSDLANLLGVEARFEPYSLPSSGPWAGCFVEQKTAIENPNAPIPLSIMIVGDSFRLRLAPWAAAFFRRSFVVHRLEFNPEMIDSFCPDIVLAEYVERFLPQAARFSFETGYKKAGL